MQDANIQKIETYDLQRPEQTSKLATELAHFITTKSLSSNIQGKQFVNVEGWQWAGSQLGIAPVLISLEDLSKEGEYKYRAQVDLIRITDSTVVGRGIAICSNKERTKKNFEEYAIASMAQTRAEGKAFRMLLSWLMKAAGYEGTPAEEMDDTERPDMPTEGEKKILVNMVFTSTLLEDKKLEALATINGCGDYKLYNSILARLSDLQPSIHEIPNPNQTDINRHLRSNVK
jgi:hypothetical protein